MSTSRFSKRWWASLGLLLAAFAIMPEGPWYREVGAVLLAQFSLALGEELL